MQSKDVTKLIKRRDVINTKIEVIQANNNKIQIDIDKLIKELCDDGIQVDTSNLSDIIKKYELIVEKEYNKLEQAVNEAEEKLNV